MGKGGGGDGGGQETPRPVLTNERCAARGKAVPLRRQVPRTRNGLQQRPSVPVTGISWAEDSPRAMDRRVSWLRGQFTSHPEGASEF